MSDAWLKWICSKQVQLNKLALLLKLIKNILIFLDYMLGTIIVKKLINLFTIILETSFWMLMLVSLANTETAQLNLVELFIELTKRVANAI